MKIERQFNKRAMELVEVQPASISTRGDLCLGIKATFHRLAGDDDHSAISMHFTPDEALQLSIQLAIAARSKIGAAQ